MLFPPVSFWHFNHLCGVDRKTNFKDNDDQLLVLKNEIKQWPPYIALRNTPLILNNNFLQRKGLFCLDARYNKVWAFQESNYRVLLTVIHVERFIEKGIVMSLSETSKVRGQKTFEWDALPVYNAKKVKNFIVGSFNNGSHFLSYCWPA